MAKATFWPILDAEARKLGERTGLDTPVVLAVNETLDVGGINPASVAANALSVPPGEYGSKAKTQRN